MKQATPYATEWDYDCPYCGDIQSHTEHPDLYNYGINTCTKCHKEFELIKEEDNGTK